MIIDNNKNMNLARNNFQNKWDTIKNNGTNTSHNMFVKNINEMSHVNPTSRNEMHNKSLAMLEQRLQNGTISTEEFNRQCQKLNKN